MSFYPPKNRGRFSGKIVLDKKILRDWIPRHHSFASISWFDGQIRFGQWEWESHRNFTMIAKPYEGVKRKRILIRSSYYSKGTRENPFPHVLVKHAHVLGHK